MMTSKERAAVYQLAELAKISRTLDLHPVVSVPAEDDSEASYEMACQAEAIRTGAEF